MRKRAQLILALCAVAALFAVQPSAVAACVAGGGGDNVGTDPYAPLPPTSAGRIVVIGTATAYYDALGWKIEVERVVKGRVAATFWLSTGVASCEGYTEIGTVHRYLKKGARLVFVTAQPWKAHWFDHHHLAMRGSYVFFLDGSGRVTRAIGGFKGASARPYSTLRQVIRGALSPDAAMANPRANASILGVVLLVVAASLALSAPSRRRMPRTLGLTGAGMGSCQMQTTFALGTPKGHRGRTSMRS